MTKQDKSIAYNIAVEIVPKIASTTESNPLLMINEVAEWIMNHQGIKGNADYMDRNYFSAAAIRSAVDMAYYNNIYIFEKKNVFVRVKPEDTTLKIILDQAEILYNSLLSKIYGDKQ